MDRIVMCGLHCPTLVAALFLRAQEEEVDRIVMCRLHCSALVATPFLQAEEEEVDRIVTTLVATFFLQTQMGGGGGGVGQDSDVETSLFQI